MSYVLHESEGAGARHIESCCGTKQKAAAARNRKLLQHGTFGNILLRGTLI